jgi:hypothetical protein
MHDRVAEVLARRAALESGVGAGIALSAFLHAAGAAIVVYAAMHQAAPEMTRVLTINLAPIAPAAPPNRAAAAAAPVPVIHEPAPVVEHPKPIAKPEPKTVPTSPFGKSAKKGSEAPAPPIPRPRPPSPRRPPLRRSTSPSAAPAPRSTATFRTRSTSRT